MIRKKSKFLTRFYISKEAKRCYRRDVEYTGKNLQECISKLSTYEKKHVTSFSIYVKGNLKINVPIDFYGNLD